MDQDLGADAVAVVMSMAMMVYYLLLSYYYYATLRRPSRLSSPWSFDFF